MGDIMRYAICLMLVAAAAWSQDYRGRLQGFVTDASSAAVSGARVVLRNRQTAITQTRESGPTGQYLFDLVEPGTYTVTAELQGFSRAVQENVLVQTRGDVTVNFTLQPGAVVESVTVTASAVSIQFNTSTRELTIDRKMLMDLPVKARNPFTLALLDPAVVNRYTAERNPFFMWSSSTIDVGGNTSRKNDLLLDGAPLQLGPKGSYAPPMDAVQEFSVQQNSVDAEFGHSAGGILSVAMKSGTNEIHGTAYYFGRNPALNAVTNPITRTPNFIRNHIGGGTVGGPVRKNKLFTFTAYELWRTKEPRDTIRTLPTERERGGDFSLSRNAAGGLRTIYDPWTTRFNAANNTATRMPFAGNLIPQNRVDPTARRIMNDIWLPNGPGDDITGVNNYKQSYFWFLNDWNFSNRTDWNISDRWKIFGRYSRLRTDLDQLNYTPNQSPAMPNDNGGIMNARNIAGDAVYQWSGHTILNFRGSFSSLEDDYNAPRNAVGEKGLDQFWPGNPWYKPYLADIPLIYYPAVSITGSSYGKGSYWVQHPRSYNFSGKLSRSRGSHYVKLGGETRHHIGDGIYPNLMNFSFGPALTSNTFLSPDTRLSGDANATFLLGAISSDSNANFIAGQSVRVAFFSLFVHDDWKIHRRVTLNLGLRYEYEGPPVDERDRYSRYLDLDNPIPEMQNAPPRLPSEVLALRTAPVYNGAWIFTGDQERAQFHTQKALLLPRAGVAIRINDRTAVTVGFARYVVPPLVISRTLERLTFPGFNATSNPLPAIEGVPQAVLSNPFPTGRNPLIPITGKALGRYTNLGGGATWWQQDFHSQVNDRINLTIQRELPGQFKVDATYFTNLGRFQPYNKARNLSDPMLSYTHQGFLTQTVPNPFYRYLNTELFPGPMRNQERVSRGSLLRPYPHYGGLTEEFVGRTRNRYQALQLRVQRTYTAGASVLFAYNYNQERNEAFFNDIETFRENFFWQPSSNQRHRMTIAGVYDVPAGKGRRFLSSAHPVLLALLGGWQSSGILTFSSGAWLQFGAMDVIGDPKIDNPGPNGWFNTRAFRNSAPFTIRANPYFFDGIRGPIFWNLDATLSKVFPVRERYNLEFRMEAYNTTNSLMWANPNMSVTSSLFGRSTGQATGNRGRELQYTLRLMF